MATMSMRGQTIRRYSFGWEIEVNGNRAGHVSAAAGVLKGSNEGVSLSDVNSYVQ